MSPRRRDLFKDKEHLVRMAAIFAGGIPLFMVLQIVLVPETFGLYGHYRAAAIGEEASKPLVHAGQANCARCHAEVVQAKQAGKHAKLGCEACHGALARHAAKPAAAKASRPDAATLCARCHQLNVARPRWMKQVDTAPHASGEACNTCHQPHSPQI